MDALILDFDGVLLESEYAGNRHLAELLTELGHPTGVDGSARPISAGSAGPTSSPRSRRGSARPCRPSSTRKRGVEDARVLREGLAAVAGAVEFVRALPAALPKAVASSSTRRMDRQRISTISACAMRSATISTAARSMSSAASRRPTSICYAAEQLGVPIADCVIIEDSPVGARARWRRARG